MNENKKDLNEILEPENDDKVEMAEDSSTVNEEGKKPKKEESNKFKMFRLFLIFIIGALAIIIFSGSWNPFKSSEVSHEASVIYEKSEDTMKDIYNKVDKINEEAKGEEFGTPDIYKPGGDFPYGFKTEDYGVEGNEEGIQKYMETVTWAVSDNFGANLKIYYMINEDYAKEKYLAFKNSMGAYADEYEFEGGKITFGATSTDVGAFIYVLKGTVVYKFVPTSNEAYEKSEGFMDLLGIDFEFPAHEDLWKGALEKN